MKTPSLWHRLSALWQPRAPAPSAPLVEVQAVRVPPPETPAPEPPPTSHKQIRAEHRAQLEAVLRETLLRAGILPTRYKSRALSLDRQSDHFIVLCELDGRDMDTRHSTLNTLEAALQHRLHASHPHLLVQQVYWRVRHPVETAPPESVMPPDFAPTQPMPEPPTPPTR